jgi:hypothetical protein
MSQVSNPDPNSSYGSIDQKLNQLLGQSTAEQPKHPGAFRRVLGAAVGIAGNVMAPGIGGALGQLIGGGINGGTAGTDPTQYLELAKQVNAQQEAFQAVSAVLKAKHDSAMAAINNIKD